MAIILAMGLVQSNLDEVALADHEGDLQTVDLV
jgi:hypothetical protein